MSDPDGSAGGLTPDDPKVAEEWRRIEQERITEERAEAREDVAGTIPNDEPAAAGWSRGRWTLAAMTAALAAGVLLAIVVNRPSSVDVEPAAEIRDGVRTANDGPMPDRGLAGVRGPSFSAANAPPEGLRVRVYLRDAQGRQRLEELLADSDLRIESGEFAVGEEALGEAERLIAQGPLAAVDALLAALAEPSASLSLEAAPPAGRDEAAAAPTDAKLLIQIIDQPAAGDGARDGAGKGG
jgi:hypothetical protein